MANGLAAVEYIRDTILVFVDCESIRAVDGNLQVFIPQECLCDGLRAVAASAAAEWCRPAEHSVIGESRLADSGSFHTADGSLHLAADSGGVLSLQLALAGSRMHGCADRRTIFKNAAGSGSNIAADAPACCLLHAACDLLPLSQFCLLFKR